MSLRFAVLVVLVVPCSPSSARADAPGSASPSPSPFALELDGQLGWVQGVHSGGATVGNAARLRYRILTAGAALQLATSLFGSVASASTLGGLSVPLGPVRFDALGELGVNAYTGVGSNFLTDDPGAAGVLPFLGVRAALLGRVYRGNRGQSIWLGLSGTYAQDLSKDVQRYTYRSVGTDWFTGEHYDEERTSSVELGQSRFAVLAMSGVSLPF